MGYTEFDNLLRRRLGRRVGTRRSVSLEKQSARMLSSVARPVVAAVVVTEDVHLIPSRVVSTGRCRSPLGRVDTSPAGRTRVGAELLRFVGCGRGCRVVFAHSGLSLLGLALVGVSSFEHRRLRGDGRTRRAAESAPSNTQPNDVGSRPVRRPVWLRGVRPRGTSMVTKQRYYTSIEVDAILIPLPVLRGLRV